MAETRDEAAANDAWHQYQRCQERGHDSDGSTYATNPPQSRCKWCGTFYRSETIQHESGAPTPPARTGTEEAPNE